MRSHTGTQSKETTAKDILLKASERILEEGKWCRGDYFKFSEGNFYRIAEAQGVTTMGVDLGNPALASEYNVPACALGTIALIDYELTGYAELIPIFSRTAIQAIEEVESRIGSEMSTWNDENGRTAQQVAEVFRIVADQL